MEVFKTTFSRKCGSCTVITRYKHGDTVYHIHETGEDYLKREEAFAMAKEYLRKKEKAIFHVSNNN